MREDKQLNFDVKLTAADQANTSAGNLHRMLVGASFSNGKRIDGNEGVVISQVENGSIAARLGLEQGDVIIGVGRVRVTNISELREILTRAKGVIALQIQREDMVLYKLIQ